MRFALLPVMLSVSVIFVGCDRDQAAAPTTQASGAPTSPAVTAETGMSAPERKPPATAATAPVLYPEDKDIDAEHDPAIRAKAKELKAITPQDLKHLKPGDEAYVLVRGDRGGGTLYGSGPYTIDSQIRKAVVHNGAIPHGQLGIVKIKVIEPEGDHPSIPANGITPTAWGKYHASYTIEKVTE